MVTISQRSPEFLADLVRQELPRDSVPGIIWLEIPPDAAAPIPTEISMVVRVVRTTMPSANPRFEIHGGPQYRALVA